jgi:hypothetical protein
MPKPRCAAVALVLTVTVMVGCGSEKPNESGRSVAARPPVEAVVTTIAPHGPADPALNLERLMAKSAPSLGHLRVTCPTIASPPSYPFECGFTARRGEPSAGVAGTVAVYGVYRPTMTYVYETRYRPRAAP